MKTIEQYKKLKEEQKLHKGWYVKYGAKYYGGRKKNEPRT